MSQNTRSLLGEQVTDFEFYKSLFENQADAIFVVNLDGYYLDVNRSFEQLTGYSCDELMEMSFRSLIVEDSVERVNLYYSKAIKGNAQRYTNALYHKNGKRVDTSITLVPIKNSDSVVVGVYGVVRDKTWRKMMEEELKRSQKRLAQAQQIARMGNWEFDPDTKTLHCSDELFRIYGLEPNENRTIGFETYFQFIHPDHRNSFFNSVNEMVNGNPYDIEFRIVRPDGQERLLRSTRTITDEGGIIGIVQDITEQKRTEQLLLKSEKLAVLGELAAGIGHEIRNPLTAIKGFIQLLQEKVNKHSEYFNIILSELDRINFIVSEFMYLAKPQASRFQSIDIKKLVYDILPLFEAEAAMNNVQVLMSMNENLPHITCEENQIKQVFINLLKNAIESMPNGGKILIDVQKQMDQIKVSFIDHGCGIPEERLLKLGEPFYSTKEKGNGLGLMVSQKIIENHKGKMQIKSEVGVGTTIDVILPVECMVETV